MHVSECRSTHNHTWEQTSQKTSLNNAHITRKSNKEIKEINQTLKSSFLQEFTIKIGF